MRRKINFIAVFGLALACLASTTFAQQQQRLGLGQRFGRFPSDQSLFNPDVVTVWHRLGVPQSVGWWRKYRDSRVNRDGLSPGKERKPPLLKIADPANLAEGAPELLKTAAKIKIDQDLAPQKIKALRYICSVGCSCYNKQTAGLVEKAVIEGLEDCTVDVRLAAIQLVIANAGNACSYGGQCETCCSEGVLKKLKEMAYKMDDNGCYVEPNARVRAKAEQALTACPPLVEKQKEEEKKKKILELEGADQTPTEELEGGGSDADNATTRSSRRSASPYQQVSTGGSNGNAWLNPELNELQVRAFIETRYQNTGDALIIFDKPYEFPTGSEVVVAINENLVSFGTILSAESGKALIHIDDDRFVRAASETTRIKMGILE